MPKTIRNKYDKYLTYDNLMKAHLLTRRGKRTKKEVVLFDEKKEDYIEWLLNELKTGHYRHGGYRRFMVKVPKMRVIEASRYMDRVVHRWVVDWFLKPAFEPQFINTTYACIKGRGVHKVTIDVQRTMKHCKRIWGDYYILKMDIAKYFKSINREILIKILERKIKDYKLMYVLKQIIYSTEEEKGLPIGNYTSQTFANIYLNEVDQYAKHVLKCKYYFRYMDDTVIFLETKEEAKFVLEKITKFLADNLKLELNDKTQIFKSKQGVNFCGYKINEYRIKIRTRGKKNLKHKIKVLKYQIRTGNMSTFSSYRYLGGHLGYIKVANTYNLENKLFNT